MIHVVAIITAKPGMREAILKEFRANVPAVHAEQGCIEYGPAIDADGFPTKFGDDTFVVIEKWESPEALEGSRSLAAHGCLWREDPRDGGESRHPRPGAGLSRAPSPASRGRNRRGFAATIRCPQISPQDITKYPQFFLLAALFVAVLVDRHTAHLIRQMCAHSRFASVHPSPRPFVHGARSCARTARGGLA